MAISKIRAAWKYSVRRRIVSTSLYELGWSSRFNTPRALLSRGGRDGLPAAAFWPGGDGDGAGGLPLSIGADRTGALRGKLTRKTSADPSPLDVAEEEGSCLGLRGGGGGGSEPLWGGGGGSGRSSKTANSGKRSPWSAFGP